MENHSKTSNYDFGYIYIVQQDPTINIYKIGKTSQLKIKDIIKQYPKNTILIDSFECTAVDYAEKELIKIFTKKFTRKQKLGYQLFEGDIDEMVLEMNVFMNKLKEVSNEIRTAKFIQKMKDLKIGNEDGTYALSMADFGEILQHSEKFKDVKEELFGYNIMSEYEKLKKIPNKCIYDKAIFNICQYLITCVENDPVNGDYYSKENNEIIKEAGRLLYEYDGIHSMSGTLSSWIPKRYRRDIGCVCDGIGEWRS